MRHTLPFVVIQNQVFSWHATLSKQQYLEEGSVSEAVFT